LIRLEHEFAAGPFRTFERQLVVHDKQSPRLQGVAVGEPGHEAIAHHEPPVPKTRKTCAKHAPARDLHRAFFALLPEIRVETSGAHLLRMVATREGGGDVNRHQKAHIVSENSSCFLERTCHVKALCLILPKRLPIFFYP